MLKSDWNVFLDSDCNSNSSTSLKLILKDKTRYWTGRCLLAKLIRNKNIKERTLKIIWNRWCQFFKDFFSFGDKWNPILIFKIKLFYWTPEDPVSGATDWNLLENLRERKLDFLRTKKCENWERTHVVFSFADLFSKKLAQITNNFFSRLFKSYFRFHLIYD